MLQPIPNIPPEMPKHLSADQLDAMQILFSEFANLGSRQFEAIIQLAGRTSTEPLPVPWLRAQLRRGLANHAPGGAFDTRKRLLYKVLFLLARRNGYFVKAAYRPILALLYPSCMPVEGDLFLGLQQKSKTVLTTDEIDTLYSGYYRTFRMSDLSGVSKHPRVIMSLMHIFRTEGENFVSFTVHFQKSNNPEALLGSFTGRIYPIGFFLFFVGYSPDHPYPILRVFRQNESASRMSRYNGFSVHVSTRNRLISGRTVCELITENRSGHRTEELISKQKIEDHDFSTYVSLDALGKSSSYRPDLRIVEYISNSRQDRERIVIERLRELHDKNSRLFEIDLDDGNITSLMTLISDVFRDSKSPIILE